jgi:CheY-like chemotaxis protein
VKDKLLFVVGADLARRRLIARQLARHLDVSAVSMAATSATVAWARAVRPAAVLTELAAAQPDGYELARRLGEDVATRDIPVVAVGTAGLEDREWARGAGCAAFVARDARPADLAQVVEACMRDGASV